MASDPTLGEIPPHWEFTTLGEICKRGGGNIQTGPFGSQLHAADYVAVGVPSIMPVNIGENRLIEQDIARITEADANRLGKHRVIAGDIIYSRRGDVERRALVRPAQEGWFCGTGCLKVRLGKGVIEPEFASHYLGHPSVRQWIVRHAVGATMPNLNTAIMEAIPFVIPPLAEQNAIAAVLGALDDKIELNRRMNATLEAMARALFQSWFVDFDPVRQNMDAKPAPCPIPEAENGTWFTYAIECQGGSVYIGQADNLRRRWKQHVDGKGAEWTKTHPPVALVFWETHDSLEAAVAREAKLKSGSGREWLKRKITERTSVRLPAGQAGAKLDGRPPAALDPATAALFPDSFQDSSLGPIPHGWEVYPLSEKIQLLSGGTPKTSEPTYWDGDIPWYSVRDAPSETDVWVIHTDKHVTKLGIANSAAQIFPEKTTIISARGTVGKLALTAVPMAMNQSCYGVRGITGYGDYFTYYSLREATAQLQQRTHGTVFDTITTETFKTLDCIFPTPQITAAFDKLVEPLLGQITANLHQSRTLATLRDTLLPKLLSGS